MFAQLTQKLGMPTEDAGRMVADMRSQRGTGTWAVGPMTVTPGVSAFNGKPFLHCTVAGRRWQWHPGEVKQHTRHVLEVVACVEYDAAYRTYLVDDVGLEPEQALAVVQDLATFRQPE
jgi:hypothetical protein